MIGTSDDGVNPTIRIMFESSPIGMCNVLLDGTILRANAAYRALAGDGVSLFDAVIPELHDALRTGMQDVVAGTKATFSLVSRMAVDPTRWGEMSMVRMRGGSGDLMVHALDVTSRQHHESALRERADTDPLTGLYNRGAFDSILGDRLRAGGRGVVYLLDLDGFKAVNDTFGHQKGDELLIAVATRIRESVRATDVVARLGGDEFALWLEGQVPQPVKIGDALIERIATIAATVVSTPRVTASIGVFRAFDGASVDQLLDCADQAMYVAKRAGKGRTVEYRPPR